MRYAMSAAAPKRGAPAADLGVRSGQWIIKKLRGPAVPRRGPEAGNPPNCYSDRES
jgi:hypothetical protein